MQTLLNPAPRRETLGANVLFQIKELLLTGKLMPGEHLSLRSTAEALGVSVMPVREAVYQLVADQALEVTPNRSVRVPVMTASQFREITDIRLQIEGFAVEQATPHAGPALVKCLKELNKELALAMDAPTQDKAAVVLLNKEIHFSIYEAAQMPMLMKIIETLWLRIGPVLNYDLRAGSERTEKKIAVEHHASLIKALEEKNPVEARTALCTDITSAFQHIYAKQFS
ncbi:GntR family transcriptional regulator [Candidimonas sp. SYP-B2681]|uniref:GntR family transcriptional regulator n=1 Tax=Candidimonas sp. SYP-B2681 TaxID=2497686 RepID=UPI000F881EBC|nr:GntR family transcriptional regulator [Candidimonas sp. SYP-B2681]RTZ44545.1 GntR family transcriptional regulator [Candidimonas sp. SYP-B2681]